MKKRIIVISLILVIMLMVCFFVYPLSLGHLIADTDNISIVCIQDNVETGQAKIDSNHYEVSVGSDAHKQIVKLFSNYKYYRYLATLLSTNGMEYMTRNINYSFNIYIGYPNISKSLILGGDGRIVINNHLYKMDIAGNKNQTVFMKELKSILENSDSSLITK